MIANDPVLETARVTADKVIRSLSTLPRGARAAELNRALAVHDRTLPSKVRSFAATLAKKGYDDTKAFEESLARVLADHAVDHFSRVGRVARSGLSGLGQTTPASTDTPQTAQGQSAANVVGNMISGIACTDALKNTIASLIGRANGIQAHDAVTTGFDITQAAAGCSHADPSTLFPPDPPPPPPAPASNATKWVAIVVGVGVVGAVGAVAWKMRKSW